MLNQSITIFIKFFVVDVGVVGVDFVVASVDTCAATNVDAVGVGAAVVGAAGDGTCGTVEID